MEDKKKSEKYWQQLLVLFVFFCTVFPSSSWHCFNVFISKGEVFVFDLNRFYDVTHVIKSACLAEV